jgi:uncharacterized RDD family membrane protein YckC
VAYVGTQYGVPPSSQAVTYAGFWVRVGAYVIDAILLVLVQLIVAFAISDVAVRSLVNFVISLVYFAGMESSSSQGTLGKMAFSLAVTDLNGHRLSFGRATGRYFAKVLSALILLIGFLMVAFSENKQGLHDKIAGTLVIKRQP